MEIKDFVERRDAQVALKEIAEKIKPLPADIVPSAIFREQTRLQLMQLDASHASSSRQAA